MSRFHRFLRRIVRLLRATREELEGVLTQELVAADDDRQEPPADGGSER